jgi:hypothetical protein
MKPMADTFLQSGETWRLYRPLENTLLPGVVPDAAVRPAGAVEFVSVIDCIDLIGALGRVGVIRCSLRRLLLRNADRPCALALVVVRFAVRFTGSAICPRPGRSGTARAAHRQLFRRVMG